MSVQVVGILLGVFSAIVSALIMWGAFQEQRRVNRAFGRRVIVTRGAGKSG